MQQHVAPRLQRREHAGPHTLHATVTALTLALAQQLTSFYTDCLARTPGSDKACNGIAAPQL